MTIYKHIIRRFTKKVGLFCNARDEKNIREWAAHHLLIGFDMIIIFDHKSKIPLKNVFSNFDKRVSIIRVELPDGNIKIPLMNKATNIARRLNLDWFIYLDADEFLILNDSFKGVKHFLNTYSYGDSVAVNWLMFGSNHHIKDPSGLLLENYERSSQYLNDHVKSFVRPNFVKFADNPHFYHMIDPYKMIGTDFKTVKNPCYFHPLKLSFDNTNAYIAHYIYQSEESYLRRKIDLIADDGSVRQNIGTEIHAMYNECLNIQPQKYVGQIKEFLDYYS